MSLNRNRGAKRAREARAEAGLDPTRPVPCLLSTVEDAFGVRVVVAPLPAGIAGACIRRAEGPVVFVNLADIPARRRFTLAHELGHVRCGHDGHEAIDTQETISGRTTDDREIMANAFAGELLVPKAAVADRFTADPGLDDVVRLAAEYGVSAYVALFRLTTADAVSPARAAALRREIDEGLHLAVYERLAPPHYDDRLEALETPYGGASALGAWFTGTATPAEVARAAGVDPRHMGASLEALR